MTALGCDHSWVPVIGGGFQCSLCGECFATNAYAAVYCPWCGETYTHAKRSLPYPTSCGRWACMVKAGDPMTKAQRGYGKKK